MNISDPYNHPKFNQDIDKKTGYVTKNILCVPIINRSGDTIGAAQLINKDDGFHSDDVEMLSVFSAQAAVCIEKAKLYEKSEGLYQRTNTCTFVSTFSEVYLLLIYNV